MSAIKEFILLGEELGLSQEEWFSLWYSLWEELSRPPEESETEITRP